MTKRTILHITADYPDVFQSQKTPVVHRLTEALDAEYDQLVVSINRTDRLQRLKAVRYGNLLSVQYFAPPKGLFQKQFLDHLARELAAMLAGELPSDALVFAHKFALEGMIAERLASSFKTPYSIGFMGNSDRTMFIAKPHYRGRYKRIVRRAQHLAFSSPWARDYFEKRLLRPAGVDLARCHIIPYISYDRISPPSERRCDRGRFLTIFNFCGWKFKNVARLVRAVGAVNASGQQATLDIAGWGNPDEVSQIRDIVSRNGGDSFVTFLGHVTSDDLDRLAAEYNGMVLPSYPESFGLVYIEALSRGIPIMCSRKAGFDGFFPGMFPGVIVDHRSVPDIADGLIHMIRQGEALLETIHNLRPQLKSFEKKEIADAYSRIFSCCPSG